MKWLKIGEINDEDQKNMEGITSINRPTRQKTHGAHFTNMD